MHVEVNETRLWFDVGGPSLRYPPFSAVLGSRLIRIRAIGIWTFCAPMSQPSR